MKILLIVPKYNLVTGRTYDYIFPLGLDYILTVIKKAGYEVDYLNLNHTDGAPKVIISSVLDSKHYDMVGTGNNSLGYCMTEMILDAVKDHISKPKTILGGPIITTEPELIFDTLKPDFGVIGEGEETILELLASIKKDADLALVDGIIFRNNKNEIIQTQKRTPIADLDSIPFPDVEGLGFEQQLENLHCNFSPYTTLFDKPRIYPLLASRSCPFQCTFCYHDGKYRKRSIRNVMDELDLVVKKYKINFILLYDDCFSFDRNRIVEFCNQIKKLQSEISWELRWVCQLMVTVTDAELLKTLKDAGCVAISYGFESFSPIVLRSMRKNITPEQIDSAFNKTLDAKMAVLANFIFGDVAETRETANATLDYWKKNCKGQVVLSFVQPYPGSEIYRHCLRKGIIKDKLDFIKNLSPRSEFNMTDTMSDQEMNALRHEISHLEATYSKKVRPINMRKTAGDTNSFVVRCPYCEKRIEYGNVDILIFSEFKSWFYGIPVLCRNCYMKFKITSMLYKIYGDHIPKLQLLAKVYLKFVRKLGEIRIKQQ